MIPVRPFNRENALRYGAYYAARLLPHPAIRQGVAAAVRTCISVQQGRADASEHAEAQAALQALRQDGLARLSSPLTAAQFDDVLAYLETVPAGTGPSAQPVTARTEGVASAAYDLPTILACPHLVAAMNHPRLLEIAAAFLGCKPTISGVGLRWSFPGGGGASDIQQFHRDMEDWKILRVFVYLTDVVEGCGPHQFVMGSHRTAGRFRLRPYSDEAVDAQFGREKVVTISGPRGTAFMADMWGVHRGVPPTLKPRLLFSATYTMTATSIYQYRPIEVQDGHLYDQYTNRLLIR